jgi:hypothetical protein
MLRIMHDALDFSKYSCVTWPDADQNKQGRHKCQLEWMLHFSLPVNPLFKGGRSATLRTRCPA